MQSTVNPVEPGVGRGSAEPDERVGADHDGVGVGTGERAVPGHVDQLQPVWIARARADVEQRGGVVRGHRGVLRRRGVAAAQRGVERRERGSQPQTVGGRNVLAHGAGAHQQRTVAEVLCQPIRPDDGDGEAHLEQVLAPQDRQLGAHVQVETEIDLRLPVEGAGDGERIELRDRRDARLGVGLEIHERADHAVKQHVELGNHGDLDRGAALDALELRPPGVEVRRRAANRPPAAAAGPADARLHLQPGAEVAGENGAGAHRGRDLELEDLVHHPHQRHRPDEGREGALLNNESLAFLFQDFEALGDLDRQLDLVEIDVESQIAAERGVKLLQLEEPETTPEAHPGGEDDLAFLDGEVEAALDGDVLAGVDLDREPQVVEGAAGRRGEIHPRGHVHGAPRSPPCLARDRGPGLLVARRREIELPVTHRLLDQRLGRLDGDQVAGARYLLDAPQVAAALGADEDVARRDRRGRPLEDAEDVDAGRVVALDQRDAGRVDDHHAVAQHRGLHAEIDVPALAAGRGGDGGGAHGVGGDQAVAVDAGHCRRARRPHHRLRGKDATLRIEHLRGDAQRVPGRERVARSRHEHCRDTVAGTGGRVGAAGHCQCRSGNDQRSE